MVKTCIAMALLLLPIILFGQEKQMRFKPLLSIGTRNTTSLFSHDESVGLGIGGQVRLQLLKRLNTEWFFDWINSRSALINKNDYHFGWSLLFYMKNNYDFKKLLQPYFIAGHCFDRSAVAARNDRSEKAGRWSMATQAGCGMHINITQKFDCSISSQYMLHFGKEIEAVSNNGKTLVEKSAQSHIDGHLLISLSFNYKLSSM